jgi:hypothetical protein
MPREQPASHRRGDYFNTTCMEAKAGTRCAPSPRNSRSESGNAGAARSCVQAETHVGSHACLAWNVNKTGVTSRSKVTPLPNVGLHPRLVRNLLPEPHS